METFHFQGITSREVKIDEMISACYVDSKKGTFGILKDHSPLVASIESCQIRYEKDGHQVSVSVTDGFLEMNNNELTLIASDIVLEN